MGTVMISDQTTIVDIRDNELFAMGRVLPQQGELIHIPAEARSRPKATSKSPTRIAMPRRNDTDDRKWEP